MPDGIIELIDYSTDHGPVVTRRDNRVIAVQLWPEGLTADQLLLEDCACLTNPMPGDWLLVDNDWAENGCAAPVAGGTAAMYDAGRWKAGQALRTVDEDYAVNLFDVKTIEYEQLRDALKCFSQRCAYYTRRVEEFRKKWRSYLSKCAGEIGQNDRHDMARINGYVLSILSGVEQECPFAGFDERLHVVAEDVRRSAGTLSRPPSVLDTLQIPEPAGNHVYA